VNVPPVSIAMRKSARLRSQFLNLYQFERNPYISVNAALETEGSTRHDR
jgi:hypothetical protein